ncbi:hypothetical protein RHGRI_010280 [Rhododendron griersonianum]|uniref:Uncharacterized protein n=1 Tax=Rhododendron griersonianum TaxID=479676 RepID=A0AAV6KHW5_9ERIC|nr:hypothetical protein RHGRI_010280 [Rhododendron griersonianum]
MTAKSKLKEPILSPSSRTPPHFGREMAAAAELVFIPSPGMGHLVSTVEMAMQLIGRDHRLSITVLIMKFPFDKSKVSSSTQSPLLTVAEDRLKFVHLPQEEAASAELRPKNPVNFMLEFVINMNKQHVRDHVTKIISTDSSQLAGFVVDMFCTPMMDVAAEFGLPTYVFFTSSCAFLGFMLHLDTLNRNQDVTELKDSDAELEVPVFVNPVPAKVLPSVVLDKEGGSTFFVSVAKRLRETKGIMVNTFEELESYAVKRLAGDDKVPPIYPVGPVLHHVTDEKEGNEEVIQIMRWLDNQPPSSVVFLCFGSMGTFDGDQLDYRRDVLFDSIKVKLVTADEIENDIRKLMENGDKSSTEGIKQKVKEMSEKSKIVIKEGGSSYNSIGRFIEDVIINVSSP